MSKPLIRTYPIKSLTIFLAISFVVSFSLLILFIFLTKEAFVIRLLIFVFCSLFSFASGFMLVNQLCFYISVDETSFRKHHIFGKVVIPFNKIDKITNKDGFYTVYAKGKKLATFTTNTKESQEIIIFLEKKGVKIEW